MNAEDRCRRTRRALPRIGLVLALAALASAAAWGKDHVLIMTISEYASSPLPGVKHDAAQARALAERLGFDTSDARLVGDRQLTARQLRREWIDLAARVRQNDRVFLYYSGHGASILEGKRCISTLVGQDEEVVSIEELQPAVDRLKATASQIVVIFDACHSGGQRELLASGRQGMRGDVARAKAWIPEPGQRCEVPINFIRSALSPSGTRGAGGAGGNVLFVAAANEREASIDLPKRGGLATVSLLDCAKGGIADTDGSGAIDAREWLACAQATIDAEIPRINAREHSRWLPHHLEGYGNVERTLPLAPAGRPVAAAAPVASAVPPTLASRVSAAFRSIEAGSNGRWDLRVSPSQSELPLDDEFTLDVDSSQAGYPYLLYVGSDTKDIRQVWPPPGQFRRLNPGKGRLPIRLRMTPPAGENTFMLLVSQVPTDLGAVLADGRAELSATTLQMLQCPSPRPSKPRFDQDPCHGMRNVSVQEEPALGAVDGYAARVFRVVGRAR